MIRRYKKDRDENEILLGGLSDHIISLMYRYYRYVCSSVVRAAWLRCIYCNATGADRDEIRYKLLEEEMNPIINEMII